MNERAKVALYRKYRPKNLDDIIGQPQVTDILKAALKKQMISHAYLFSGPRGTGKTSAARILAHEFNDIEYSENLNLDIIEIDAASNRRIEDIRDLREVVKLAPTKLKYKVYIIDEVHMLTNESFNALLKTLEEPPEHAIFILATTDLHKVPATILSRTQKFIFKLLSVKEMGDHLKYISEREGIEIDDTALNLIAELSGGSVRDGISILDQLRVLGSDGSKKIDQQFVRDVMGMPSLELKESSIDALKNFDSGSLLSLVAQMLESGSDAKEIIKNLISLSAGLDELTNLHLSLIDDLGFALNTYNPELFLKIAILKFNPNIRQVELAEPELVAPKLKVQGEQKPDTSSKSDQKSDEANQIKKESSLKLSKSDRVEVEPEANDQSADKDSKTLTPPSKKAVEADGQDQESDNYLSEQNSKTKNKFNFSDVQWVKVLEEVKTKSASTYAVLRLAKAEIADQTLNLIFKFDFHKKKLDEAKNKKILLDSLSLVFGFEPDLNYTTDKNIQLTNLNLSNNSASSDELEANPEQESILSKVSDIMGGGEVIET